MQFEFAGIVAGLICTGIIWIIILILALIQVFRRTDIENNTKILWLLAILLFPFAGLLVYILANFQKAKNLLWIGLIGIALSVSLTVYFVYAREHRDVSSEKGIQVTAQQLFEAFVADETKANGLYLDKAIQITGEVMSVTTNQDGNIVVDFKTNDPFFVINCTFKTDPGALKAGDTITFKGICTGYIPDANVVINEGVLVK
ncbi:OB-fold protein [Sediminibacterium goheungense]|uniref:Phospholipase D-like protein n=1 Tax=Sediminibacterium goheungense TaxID=1086393 RepID=A0A4R6IVP6_9BACT|nr:PLDc N-terminal domain-containing protein [Sediminibacterium goheungense]TDO26417.1 phospholipase D-like protein [Sediminibacterium goheungense]